VQDCYISVFLVHNETLNNKEITAPNLTYTPTANYFGIDSFTFKVNDGESDLTTATVNITVTDVVEPNVAPIANTQTVSLNEDTPKVITLTANDVNGDTLTYSIVSQPTNGTLTGTSPNLTYTPTLNYIGADERTFKANDGKVDSATVKVSINVTSVNDAPTAEAGVDKTVEVNKPIVLQKIFHYILLFQI